jgi:hypothetical protein
VERDRDEVGRPRNARARDGLGRPLPRGAAGDARVAEGVFREPAATLALAQQLLDAHRPFHAHEVLEDGWKAAPPSERELWRGLAQLAVGLTHEARGNATGAATLLRRGAASIAPYADQPPHGVDVAGLLGWADDRLAGRLSSEPSLTTRSAPMSVTAFQDLPLAERDREWDATAAEKRVRSWAGAEVEPNEKYRDAHIWYDHDARANFTAYKLLIADVIDGTLTAVPRAIMAAGAVLQGSRGGIDLPKSDVERVRSHVAKYYSKLEDTPPWERSD